MQRGDGLGSNRGTIQHFSEVAAERYRIDQPVRPPRRIFPLTYVPFSTN